MGLSRRELLGGGAALGAALVLPAGAAAAAAAAGSRSGSLPFALTTWQPLVGATVRVADIPGSSLRVVSVTDRSSTVRKSRVRGHGDVFIIRFAGLSGPLVPEGIHTVEHPAIGRRSMFLRPAGAGAAYQAVVNTWLPDKGGREAVHHVGSLPR